MISQHGLLLHKRENPMSSLEDIASLASVRVSDVVRNLPEGEAICIDGSHFVRRNARYAHLGRNHIHC